MFLTSLDLKDELITHGFFGRKGGVSKGIFSSLNCGIGSGDNADDVAQNRQRVAAAMEADILLTVRQEHTNQCVTVTEPWTERPTADAMVTNMPGLVLGVLTADCAPVLFYALDAKNKPLIGAAHAGWRGAIGGVLENTVKAMQDLGAEKIQAVIGPCIGPQSYEVSPDFKEPFLIRTAENEQFFKNGRFDLPAYVQKRLKTCRVECSWTGQDTYAESDNFFSYRRSQHRNEPDYGRQISTILINI